MLHVCVVDVLSILSGGKLPFSSLGMRRYGRKGKCVYLLLFLRVSFFYHVLGFPVGKNGWMDGWGGAGG